MGTGLACGGDGRALGPTVGAFVDDEGGYTTVAVAVALLVSLSLVFGSAAAQWVGARSAEVQQVADAVALSGENAVAAYSTVAQVLDACVLSMGLAGFVTCGAGLAVSCVPGLAARGAQVTKAGARVLDARRDFSRQANEGLQRLEGLLPALVVANSGSCARANSREGLDYVGCAVPFPLESQSDFGALEDGADGNALTDLADRLGEESSKAQEAKERAREALERGWIADCGSSPYCLRERAAHLAGLADAQNPDYASPEEWTFGAPLLRARRYYAARLGAAALEGRNPEELTDAACRRAFYSFALDEVRRGEYAELDDGMVVADLPALPCNAEQTRAGRLYTDALWPVSREEGGRVLHSWDGCPGALGGVEGAASLHDLEQGAVSRCEVCRMDVSQMGKVASASTSIENGFEHHWRLVVEAAGDYAAARADLAEAERSVRELADGGAQTFAEAVRQLSVRRPSLCPPGAWGCVAVVARGESAVTPSELTSAFVSSGRIPAGAAVSAAALAPDGATADNNVLSSFFDGLADSGSLVVGVADGVLGLWGRLLVGYGSLATSVSSTVGDFLGNLDGVFGGTVGSWLANRLDETISLLGIQPADMRLRKPVTVNSQDVLDKGGLEGTGTVRTLVEALPESGSVMDYARTLGIWAADEYGPTVTVANLEIPGTDISIPLTVDVSRLGDYLRGETQ